MSQTNNQVALGSSSLQMPTVSGVVNIPLAELDHMRAEHVRAVKMAQDLEARRMEVLIIIQENKEHYSISARDGRSAYQGIWPAERSRSYKNLDEVKEDIRRVEMEKVKNLIQGKTAIIEDLEEKLYVANTDLAERKTLSNRLTTSNITILSENKTLLRTNEEFKEIIKGANETMESQATELTKLKAEYLKLEHKKSFWSWM